MADDLSLLFKLKAQNQASPAFHAVQADAQKLKAVVGSEFAQMQSAAKSAFESIAQHLNIFVGQRIPLVGGAFVRITENLRGLGTAASSTGEELAGTAAGAEAAGASIAGMAGPIGIAILAVVGLAVAAALLVKELFNLAEKAADFRGKLFDMSQQTGLSVETLSALEVAARTTGGSLEQIVASLGIFQKHLENAQDPTSKESKLLGQLGIETTNTEVALRQTLIRLAAMPEGFRQTATALELFGRGGKSILAILKETNGNLDGAITKFREMGLIISTEDAKAADEFNDQLAILGFQVRALVGQEVIPAALGALKALSVFLKENKQEVRLFGQALGVIASTVLVTLLARLHEIERVLELINKAAVKLDQLRGTTPVKITQPEGEFVLPGSQVPSAPNSFLLQQQSDALKAANEEAKRLALVRIADAERLFKLGQITRQQETEAIIAASKTRLAAEKAALNAELVVRNEQLSKDQGNVDVIAQITKLQQDIRDKDTDFAIEAAKRQADLQTQERKDLIDHEQRKRDILLSAGDARIAIVDSQIKEGLLAASDGEVQRETIEAEQFAARRAFLDKELSLAGKEPAERQKITDAIEALDQERTANVQVQADRRTEISRKEGQSSIDLLLGTVDTILRLGQISDERQIASAQDLALTRVRTEEEAAQAIFNIRIAAIDREVDAVKARLTAAGALTDPLELAKQEAALNNELQVLAAQRVAIQDQGDRDIEKGRQTDLANERQYAEEVIRIQRETARTVVDLLILHHARRADIIKAQADFEIEDENKRHAREEDRLIKQRANNEAIEAEAERHRLELQRIREQQKQDEDAIDSLGEAIDSLGQKVAEALGISAEAGIQLASILKGAFDALSAGVGNLVQNYVLLGTTGPAALRKLLAATLAQIAAESAVKAIYWTAQGIVDLFFNPARAAADFTAAALFASIAGVAALAGRAVAGDTFKQPSAGASSGGRSSSGASSGSGSPTTQELDRRNFNVGRIQGDATLTLRVPHGWLGDEMRKDYDLNGYSRLLIKEGA